MNDTHSILASDPVVFAPIPVASGKKWTSPSGGVHDVASMAVVMTTAGGDSFSIPLDQVMGAWWLPTSS